MERAIRFVGLCLTEFFASRWRILVAYSLLGTGVALRDYAYVQPDTWSPLWWRLTCGFACLYFALDFARQQGAKER